MTNEYPPGTEDIAISVEMRDGRVVLGIYLTNGQKLYGVMLDPEVARTCAQKLTFASWKAEEGRT